jgi:hypothetical protein
MTTTTALPAEYEQRQTRDSLVFGIVLWFVHLNVVYALASLACTRGWFSFSVGPMSGLQVVETIISALTVPLMLLLIYLPWRAWRRFQTEVPRFNPHLLLDTEKERPALVAFVVMLLNSSFLLFVFASFVPMLALSVCRPS